MIHQNFHSCAYRGGGGVYKPGNRIKRREKINENFPKFILQDQKYRIFLFCKNSNSSLIQSLRWLYPFDDYILNLEILKIHLKKKKSEYTNIN